MLNYRIVFLIIIVAFTGMMVEAQLFRSRVNRFSEEGKRQGLWLSYWDEEDKILMSKARYIDGKVKRVSKEYHLNGNLRLKMRYQKDRIRVKYYFENRKLEQKGWAILEYNPDDIHYFWHGIWKFYDSRRKRTRVAYYENGEEIITN